jgi:periplasmic protein CpxP/Spy
MKLRGKISIVALAIVLTTGIAIAQGHGGPHGGGGDFFGGPMLGYLTDVLDLTDAQQAQIKQIIATQKPAMQPLFTQEKESHQAMMQLIQSGSFDQGKAQTIASQEAQIHAQLEVLHAQMASQAYQILTADQKTKLAQVMAKHQQRMQQHMQEHQAQTPNQ